jgi:hypothetical protein
MMWPTQSEIVGSTATTYRELAEGKYEAVKRGRRTLLIKNHPRSCGAHHQ